MFNDYFVMSQRDIKAYCEQKHSISSIVISINNSFEMDLKLPRNDRNKIRDILYLYFDDVFKSELTQDKSHPQIWLDRWGRAVSPITEKDCQKIHDFVMKYYKSENTYNLIVQCEMGVSRSAATMAAIKKALYNNDKDIFDNRKYRPNPDVYREVLNKFMEYNNSDSLKVDNQDNLRFGIEKTPYGYTPIFKTDLSPHTVYYTPSVELCNIMPELKNVVQPITEIYGSGMPFYRFPFASMLVNDEEKKSIFNGAFAIDKNMYEHREDATSYKDSFSYQLMELAILQYLPDVTFEKSKEVVNGVEYDATYYYILLRNKTSPYFYQKCFGFNRRENHDFKEVAIEIEYSFPNGYKTWAYYTLSSDEVKRAKSIVGYTKFEDILEVAFDSADFLLSDYANNPIVDKKYLYDINVCYTKDCETFCTEDNDNIYTVIFVENCTGLSGQISFTKKDWENYYLNDCISNIRIVNF